MKNLKNLGKVLPKIEQQSVHGGRKVCSAQYFCPGGGNGEGEICYQNGGYQGTVQNGLCCV